MSRWFRFYADAVRNPKVAALSDSQFRLWVDLLAVASENEGHIPHLDSLKHVLNRRLDHLSKGLEGLLRASLIDPLTDGYEPHNWVKFQYKSDTSTERVHKFREKRNVSETPPEQKQSRTDVVTAKAITTPRKRALKGTRIDPAWKPGALPLKVEALVAQWPAKRVERELDNFRDYWRTRSRDACRLDWDLTWHNRIRDIHDRVMKGVSNGRQDDKRSGAARALDSRLGFGEFAGTAGRYGTGDGDEGGVRALTGPTASE